MDISYRMAAMSHLSDAQELLNMGQGGTAEGAQLINRHIRFAKKVIMKQMTHDATATEEELDKIWEETK